MHDVEIKPDKLAGSISRIVDSISSSNYNRSKQLPHSGLAFGIGLPIALLAGIAVSMVFFSSATLPARLIFALITAIPLTIPPTGLIQIYFLWKELDNTIYRITAEGIQIEDNYLDKSQKNIRFDQITDAEMEKPLILRFFGKGNVKLNTAGSNIQEAQLKYIGSPELVKDQITEMIQGTRQVNPGTGRKIENETGSLDQEISLKPDLTSAMVSTVFVSIFVSVMLGVGIAIGTWLEMGSQYVVPAGVGGMALIFPLMVLGRYFNLKATEYRFLEDHLEIYEGFLTVKEESIPYNRITDISLSRPILQRFFNTGAITVNTAGSNAFEGSVSYIKNPDQQHKKLKEILKL